MRPKPPSPQIPPKVNPPTDPFSQSPRLRPQAQEPELHPSLPGQTTSRGQNPPDSSPDQGHNRHPEGNSESPRIEVSDLPSVQHETTSGLTGYLLNPGLLRNMQPANEEGLRYIVGRKFVDIKDTGTVYVEFDASLGTYRVMDLYKKLPSGPALYRNAGETTWSPIHPPQESLKRPHSGASDETAAPPKQSRVPPPEATPAQLLDLKNLLWRDSDAQGYHRWFPTPVQHWKEVPYTYAFKGPNNTWVKVDPPNGFNAQPNHLKNWTDYEIWKLYGIHGQDIQRFRIDAQTSGTRPQWAKATVSDEPWTELPNDALKWLYPDMTVAERQMILKSYNLSPVQLSRLNRDMSEQARFPEWAEQHKTLSQDANNPTRFDQLYSEIAPKILPIRNGTDLLGINNLEKSFTHEFYEGFLTKLGYSRNKYNLLYRTDVPAVFRGDERTAFELVNDGWMLPRYKHTSGITTHKPMSVTVSFDEARMYGRGEIDPEYLLYNRQTNKYPGKKPGDTSDESDSGESTETWSDSDTSLPMDEERNYPTTRHNQNVNFIYLIDSRGMEVVPGNENDAFNEAAASSSKLAWDDCEVLLSTSRRGLSADRIWLFHSDLKRAARIKDVVEAGDESIGNRTYAGAYNAHEYDRLIDQVAAAGKPVLIRGNAEFGNDIVWPLIPNNPALA